MDQEVSDGGDVGTGSTTQAGDEVGTGSTTRTSDGAEDADGDAETETN